MTKELQDLAWSVLPKEFKEEVKDIFQEDKMSIITAEAALVRLFGHHNLTSDAEGEVMMVSRKVIQEAYAANERIKKEYPQSIMYKQSDAVNGFLWGLFGSKCLPEPSKLQASCRQVNVDSLEPKPAEPNPDGDNLSPEPQPANRTPSSYTQPATDCHHTDRLHIAAMAMQALFSNADRMKKYEDVASYHPSDNLTRIVARNALRYADVLVAEAQKGGEK